MNKFFKEYINENKNTEKKKYIYDRVMLMRQFGISRMNMRFSREDKINIETKRNGILVKVKNYVLGSINIEPSNFSKGEFDSDIEKDIKIEVKIPVITYYNYFPSERDSENSLDIPFKTLINSLEVLEIKLGDEKISFNKKDMDKFIKLFSNIKPNNNNLRDFVKKNLNINKSSIFQLEEVQNAYKKIVKEETKIKNKIDKDSLKVINKIARKYKVNPKFVVAPSENKYVIFDSEDFDRDRVNNLLNNYDSELWAVDIDYKKVQKSNENIEKELKKIGTGKFYYITNPGGNNKLIEVIL